MGERMSWKKEIRRNRVWRKWLAVWMMLALLVQSVPGAAFGAVMSGDGTPYSAATAGAGGTDGSGDGTGTGICPHHTRHTEECGYQEAHPCSHVHTAECYEVYDEDGDDGSGYEDSAATAATGSNAAVADGGTTVATPSNATPSRVLNCPHSHDEGCGYTKAQPCEYECKICAGAGLSLEEQAKLMEEQMAMQPFFRSGLSKTGSFRFTVGSEEVLRELQEKVADGATWANGTVSYAESSYVLNGDIWLTDDWTPVGTEEKPFTGTFDGDGYVIYGMVIDDPGLEHSGLFGYVKDGTVEKVGLKDVDILGGENTGAVAGTVYRGTVSRCFSTGNVEAAGVYPNAGGIVGCALEKSSVFDCYSLADVEGNNAGGIAGNVRNSAVGTCYSTGQITAVLYSQSKGMGGGLVGVFKLDENRSIALTDSAALNPSIEGAGGQGKRGVAVIVGMDYDNVDLRGIYGFTKMKVMGKTASGGADDNEDGADFWYDAGIGTFSTPWETIFRDSDAWDFGDGKLPTLKDAGGQDGEIPEWMIKETAADLHIENADELVRFRDRVNGTAGAPEDFKGRTVRLTADIDLNELDGDEDWVPIGTSLNGINCRFSGTFDGGGHVIRGVTVRGDATYAGLFGQVAGGRIQNLGLKDVDIDVTGDYAGAAAGYLNGGEIVNCYSTGIVTSDEGNAGGIAGSCEGEGSKIENCYSTAAVRGQYAGGIAGRESKTKGMIENCYFAGNAVTGEYTAGGIRGDSYTDSHIRNCAALNAAVTVTDGYPARRIAADDEDSGGAGSSTVLKNNYAFSGMEVNGALVAADDAKLGGDKAHGADLSYDKNTGEFSVPWETIFGEEGVKAWDIGDGKLPTLKDIAGQDGEIPEWLLGEAAADLYIGSAKQLAEFRDRVNGANGKTAENFKEKTVRLTADINLDELDGDGDWTPIGAVDNQSGGNPFSGTFDGDGHVISGLTIRGDAKLAGLFGKVAGGRIRNLGLKDVVIDCGAEHAGAVAGLLQGGEITNCYSAGIVRTTEDSIGYAGGIAAQMLLEYPAGGFPSPTEPKIENCYSTAAVEGKCAGGITGMGTKTIKNCYFAGNAVTGTELAGGIAGDFPPLMGVGVNHCAALNVDVDSGTKGSASRIIGGSNGDKTDNYAFSGMKVNGKIISEDHDKVGKDKVHGANLSYDRNVGEFDVSWVNIFDEESWNAWDIAPYKLPTLKGIGGQDGEIPLWLSEENAADLYIGSAEELAMFRDKVNVGELVTFKTVRLTADIELDSSVEWVPIGTIKDGNFYPFCGVFDGGGHVIRGLTLRGGGEKGKYVGLFGNLYGGEIRNLGVTDVDIDCKASYAGAVAGILVEGKISNCYSTGVIRMESADTSSAGCAGGIAGVMDTYSMAESIVENCYSTASVTGPYAGGVIGGITGGKGTVRNCYFAGNAVSGTGTGGAGGIWGGVMSDASCSIQNCAALNIAVDEVSGSHARIINDSAVGGSKKGNNYAFSGMKLNGNAVPESDAGVGADRIHGANLSYDRTTGQFDVSWETIFGAGGAGAWDIGPYRLPTLKGIAGQDGEIPLWLSEENAADLYIGSETDLIRFRDRVNGTGASDMESFEGRTVRLTADITLGGGSDWTPIGEGAVNMFSGTFDGGGHVIRGLKINDENKNYLGLFGQIYGGTVRNLGLEEVRINGRAFIGGIAGYLGKGSSVLNCYSMGRVRGDESVGGLVGAAFGKLRNEDDRQKIVIRNCWYAGDAEARDSTAGGIAGGFVYGCEMEHCYSIGKTAAKATGGGLIGCVSDRSSIDEFTGAVRYNAALMRTVDGPDDVGRIYGTLLVSSAGSGWKENYAWSGMTVGGTAVQGDDGTGKNGKDGTPGEIVLNRELFPASDWILQEGYYPRLRQFAGGTPIPLDVWLGGQSDGAFAMTMTPGAYRFPDAEAGYGAQGSAVFTVKNTGREKIDSLTVELTDAWTDGGGISGAAAGAPYFVLMGTDALADISAGETASFGVAPAAGLTAGTYRATVSVTGSYGLKEEAAVEFTVTPKAEPEPEFYSVTVEHDGGGTAGADYDKAAEGTPVELKAVPRNGYRFKEWQGAENLAFTQGSSTSQTAVFNMPGRDVAVKAIFEKDAPAVIAVTGVALNKTELALTVGTTKKLTATVTPENASDRRVTWTSGDPDIASVEADGTVTALKAGTAVVAVRTADGSYTANCNVTVTLPPNPGNGNDSSDSSLDDAIRVDDRILQGTWEQQEDGGWKFHKTDGEYARDQWGKIDGLWYHFDGDADMQTGWQNVDGQWYYLATEEDAKNRSGTGAGVEIGTGSGGGGVKSGSMMTGWYYDSFYQRWFYLGETGIMAIGWQQIDGKWYYFNPLSDGMRGAMLADAWIDGWYVDKNGVWVE